MAVTLTQPDQLPHMAARTHDGESLVEDLVVHILSVFFFDPWLSVMSSPNTSPQRQIRLKSGMLGLTPGGPGAVLGLEVEGGLACMWLELSLVRMKMRS